MEQKKRTAKQKKIEEVKPTIFTEPQPERKTFVLVDQKTGEVLKENAIVYSKAEKRRYHIENSRTANEVNPFSGKPITPESRIRSRGWLVRDNAAIREYKMKQYHNNLGGSYGRRAQRQASGQNYNGYQTGNNYGSRHSSGKNYTDNEKREWFFNRANDRSLTESQRLYAQERLNALEKKAYTNH